MVMAWIMAQLKQISYQITIGLNAQKTKWDFSASSMGSGAPAGKHCKTTAHTQSDSFMCCIVPHMRALEAIRTAYIQKAYNLRSKLDSFGISYWSQGVKESLKLCSTFWAAVCVDRQELPMKDKAPLQASRGFGPRSNTLHVPGVLLVL